MERDVKVSLNPNKYEDVGARIRNVRASPEEIFTVKKICAENMIFIIGATFLSYKGVGKMIESSNAPFMKRWGIVFKISAALTAMHHSPDFYFSS